MLSLFGCKNCKNANSELIQAKDELVKLKRENKRVTVELAQASAELLKSRFENKRLSGELQAAQHQANPQSLDLQVEVPMVSERALIEPAHSDIVVPVQIPFRTTPQPTTIYIASWNRNHFHRPNCVWMENLPESKLRRFSSHEEAVKAGCRPCKTCCA